jgi:hypothetical protein
VNRRMLDVAMIGHPLDDLMTVLGNHLEWRQGIAAFFYLEREDMR